jgi:orotate phosphoribosyltransferase
MASIMAQDAQTDAESVSGQHDPRWCRLREIILDKSLKLGDFILTSGVASKYLFQLRQTTMLPEGAALIGEIVVEYMQRNAIKCVGGLELGAVPLVSAVSVASHYKSYPVDAFFVRKAAKEHGARERIDGHVRVGEDVLITDDVATSGKSILIAIDAMKEEFPSCTVRRALVVVDRQEGAAQNLAARGVQLVSLFKKSDFPINT